MSEFKQYLKKQIAELRPVTDSEIEHFARTGQLPSIDKGIRVSISDADLQNGSPIMGDMIARNPKNHTDQWLVAEQYFKDNFEKMDFGDTGWKKGKPPTDDDGHSMDVLGAIPTKKGLTVFPVRIDHGEWRWVESGEKISKEYEPVKWMYYPAP